MTPTGESQAISPQQAPQLGLVFPLLDTDAASTAPDAYRILGNPPSFETITRDTFPAGTRFSTQFILNVLRGIASACQHLHTTSHATALAGRSLLMHGDLYAHNILVQRDGSALLTDFGAASFKLKHTASDVDDTNTPPAASSTATTAFTAEELNLLERIEVRAFGCLVDDLLMHHHCQNDGDGGARGDGEQSGGGSGKSDSITNTYCDLPAFPNPPDNSSVDVDAHHRIMPLSHLLCSGWLSTAHAAVADGLDELSRDCCALEVIERPDFQCVAASIENIYITFLSASTR